MRSGTRIRFPPRPLWGQRLNPGLALIALIVLVILVIGVVARSDAAHPRARHYGNGLGNLGQGGKPDGRSGQWKLVFDDGFNRSSLNRSLWSASRFHDGRVDPGFSPYELECFVPAETTVRRGEADLNIVSKSERCGGVTKPYAAGILTTQGKWSFTYGFMEARIWLPGGKVIGDWPGFFASGLNWPIDGEIDVVEGLTGQPCWHFHNTSGPQGGCARKKVTGGWHIFGADWQPGSVTYYYDGIKVGRITSGITSAPMYLILEIGAANVYAGPTEVPARMRVEYVKVWKSQSDLQLAGRM